MPRVAKVLFFFLHMHPPLALLPQHFLFFFPSHFGSASRGRWMCGGGDDTCQRQRLQVRRSLAARSSRRARTLQQAGRGNQPTSPLHPSTPRGVCTTNGGVGGGGEAGRACERETVGENKKKRGPSVINSYVVFVWPASSEDASRARTTSNWIL